LRRGREESVGCVRRGEITLRDCAMLHIPVGEVSMFVLGLGGDTGVGVEAGRGGRIRRRDKAGGGEREGRTEMPTLADENREED